MNDAAELTAQNERPVQVKEEEEETEKQPAAKRKRGQSKSQTTTGKMPKEEIKSGGKVDFIVISVVSVVCNTIRKCNRISKLLSNWSRDPQSAYGNIIRWFLLFRMLKGHVRCYLNFI